MKRKEVQGDSDDDNNDDGGDGYATIMEIKPTFWI
jgi:hypothetical protein